jgi:hypothetical protein
MKIILDVDGEYSLEEIKLYLKSIKIDSEFINSITFEKDKTRGE